MTPLDPLFGIHGRALELRQQRLGLTIRWAPIVDDEHVLAKATAHTSAAASRVRRGDDIRLIIGGADAPAQQVGGQAR